MIGTSALSALSFQSTRADYPAEAFKTNNVNDILLTLFGTTEIGEDGGLEIEMAQIAESQKRIPFKITARHSEKVAIIVEQNQYPLVLVADATNYPNGVIIGTMDLNQSSTISVYAFRQDLLFRNSRLVQVPGV